MRQLDRSIPGRTDVPTMPKVIEALHEIVDPELGIDIVELGLVYEIEIAEKDVYVKMTMTSQACPVGPQMLDGVKRNIEMRVPGVRTSNVTLVFDPPWSPEMMTPEARKSMGW